MKKILYFFLLIFIFNSCIEVNNSFSKLPPGIWRATLLLDNTPYAVIDEEVSVQRNIGDVLPFLLDVVYDDEENFHFEIINEGERIIIDDISYGRDMATAKDTVTINFPIFDSYIKAIYEENILEGQWYVNNRENYSIPFKAYYGQGHLFSTDTEKPEVDVTGKWEVTFEIGTDDEYPAIGEFVQEGNKLSGTFLTETGDYRFLTGQVLGRKIYLSTFDGAHAFLFTGKVMEDNSIVGAFRSGTHYTTNWIATKNENAQLADAYTLTKVIDDSKPLDFTFKSISGEMVSLSDEKYQGKPKLVKLFGTWCPNCRDESKFLIDYFKKNNDLPIEVIELGFERYRDQDKAIAALKRYKEKMNVPFEILLAGYFEKDEAITSLPMLNKIISFPTLLFVNRENKIIKTYTGFTGPATSEYQNFIKEFEKNIQLLVN